MRDVERRGGFVNDGKSATQDGRGSIEGADIARRGPPLMFSPPGRYSAVSRRGSPSEGSWWTRH